MVAANGSRRIAVSAESLRDAVGHRGSPQSRKGELKAESCARPFEPEHEGTVNASDTNTWLSRRRRPAITTSTPSRRSQRGRRGTAAARSGHCATAISGAVRGASRPIACCTMPPASSLSVRDHTIWMSPLQSSAARVAAAGRPIAEDHAEQEAPAARAERDRRRRSRHVADQRASCETGRPHAMSPGQLRRRHHTGDPCSARKARSRTGRRAGLELAAQQHQIAVVDGVVP